VLLIVPGAMAQARQLTRRMKSPLVSTWASGDGHAATGLGRFLALQHSGTFALETDGTVLHARTAALPTGRQ